MRERNDGPLRKIRDQRRGCCLEKTRVINCNAANRQKIATRPRVARSCRARAPAAYCISRIVIYPTKLRTGITSPLSRDWKMRSPRANVTIARACARASLPRTFDFSTLMALYTRSQCCVCGIATCGRAFYLPAAHVVRRVFRKKKRRKKKKLSLASRPAREIANYYCQLSAERVCIFDGEINERGRRLMEWRF